MRKFLTLAIIFLAGCATQANYEKVVDSWIGASESDLVRSWGIPANSFNSGGSKFIQYSNARNVTIPGTAPTYNTNCYDTGYSTSCYTNEVGGTNASNYTASCETTFEIKNEKVVNWSFRGNDCIAFSQD